jgi:hypothetical protein
MVAEFAPEPIINSNAENEECVQPALTLVAAPEEPEVITYRSHRRLHGMCYKTECVEQFGMPLDTALGSFMLKSIWS